MQFEYATFAQSGRSVRIADAKTPYQVTLAWLCCLYFHSYEQAWALLKDFEPNAAVRQRKLYTAFLRAMLQETHPPKVLDIEQYRPSKHNPARFLELAFDLETGVTPFGPLKDKTDRRDFIRRTASPFVDVPGYARGMFCIAELFEVINGWRSCLANPPQGLAVAMRGSPHTALLTQYNTPGAQYAQALMAQLSSWDEVQDRALVFHP